MQERVSEMSCDAEVTTTPAFKNPRPRDERGQLMATSSYLCGTCVHRERNTAWGDSDSEAIFNSKAGLRTILRPRCVKWKVLLEVQDMDPDSPMPDEFLPESLQPQGNSSAQ